MYAPEFLIEIDAWTGAGVETLRVSSHGYTTAPGDDPANEHYLACIADPGDFSRHLYGPNRTTGPSEASYGDVRLTNPDGVLDAWMDYGFDGREIRIYRLAVPRASFSSRELVLRATVEAIDGGNAWTELRLRLYDRRRALDKALQENVYAGTTTSGGPTAEGNEDLKDQVKPLVYGKVVNVPAIPVNVFDLIYQVNDGAVASIDVYDGGVGLTPNGDQADLAALQGATIRPGQYATCLALGLFRLGGAPEFTVTADVVEGATEADRYPGAIVGRMLAKMGLGGDYVAATADALDAAAPYEVGIWIDDETSGLAAIDEVLASVGGFIVPNDDGDFEVGRLEAPGTSAGTITDREIESDVIGISRGDDTDGGIPAWRVTVKYGRNYEVQQDGDLGGCVNTTRRAWLAKETREAAASDSGVKTKHLLSPEFTMETLLVDRADAETEATRLLGLYGTRRDIVTFPVAWQVAETFPLNETATVQYDRYGYDTGRPMRVIGRREIYRSDQVELTLWG